MSLEFFFSFVGAATGSLLLFVGVAATEFAVILGLLNVEIYVTVRIEGRSSFQVYQSEFECLGCNMLLGAFGLPVKYEGELCRFQSP